VRASSQHPRPSIALATPSPGHPARRSDQGNGSAALRGENGRRHVGGLRNTANASTQALPSQGSRLKIGNDFLKAKY